MKKMLFLTAAATLFFAGQSTAEDGRYIRKQPAMKTDFFVPSQAINTEPEKLPPFYSEQAPQPAVQQAKIMEIASPDDDIPARSLPADEEASGAERRELPDYLNENAAQSQTEGPEYKQEYAAYQRDLATIAKTGKPSPNPALEMDLAKMNSEERLSVSSDGTMSAAPADRINPMAYAAQPDNKVEILEAVETVRENPFEVPETEDSSTVSGQGESPALEPGLAPETPEIQHMAPETAAHFQGMNPFREDIEPPKERISKEEKEETPQPSTKEILPDENEEKIEQQHPKPTPYVSKIKRRNRRPVVNAVR